MVYGEQCSNEKLLDREARERTTMDGRTMATGKAVLLNSAIANSVSILVNVYVFTWPLCCRYSFACHSITATTSQHPFFAH